MVENFEDFLLILEHSKDVPSHHWFCNIILKFQANSLGQEKVIKGIWERKK